MIIEVTNTYHDTKELFNGNSLEEVKQEYYENLWYTAQNLGENEVEIDWDKYYNTYEEAENATIDGVYEQLVSELEFKVVG